VSACVKSLCLKIVLQFSFLFIGGSLMAQSVSVTYRSDTSSKDHVIRRELKTSGQPFTREDLIRSQKEIANLKIFAESTEAPVNYNKRKWLIGGVNVVGYGGTLILLNQAWYKNEDRTSFHTFNDSKEWLQVDKIGHGWSAYNTARATAGMWKWAGLPDKKAAWIGGLTSTAFLTGVEFLDAHSYKWGWSWSDIAANLVGSGLFIGQELLWKEQRIQYKFSFHGNKYNEPMLEDRADNLFGKSWYERMLKDYNAQTYWFSANLKSFLPKSNLPAWLNVAVGYGASGMFGGFENKWIDQLGNEVVRDDIPRKRQFYLSPDIDFTRIKTKSKFLKTAFFMLNSFKFPAPALMLDNKGKMKGYLIYF
jgi:hypothetical protein